MRTKLVLILALLLASPVWATTWYVNGSTGNNSYDGTEPTHTSGTTGPFLTIGQSLTVDAAGDTVEIAAGTYNETLVGGASGTAGNPITFTNYLGGTVILTGGKVPSGWTLDTGSIYEITGWTPPYAGFVWQDNFYFLKQAASVGAMTAGSWYYDGSSTLYVWATDSASPATHAIEASWYKVGFYSGTGGGNTVKSYITLSGLTMQYYGRSVESDASVISTNWELAGITSSFAPDESIWVVGGSAYCQNWYVHDSTFTQNHGHGAQFNCDNLVAVRNKFSYNEWGQSAYTNGGAGLLIGACSNDADVEYNQFANNGYAFGLGLILETTCVQNAKIEHNDFLGNYNGCVGLAGAQNNTIAYNQCHDNLRGVSISAEAAIQNTTQTIQAPTGAATGNKIYSNTLNNNYGGIYSDAASSVGLFVMNNIICNQSNQSIDTVATSSAVLDYNDYFQNTLSLTWNGTNYSSLATYQSASSQDAHALNVDPLFTSVVYGWDGFEHSNFTCAGDGAWWEVGACSTATMALNTSVVHSGLMSAKVVWTGTSQSAHVYDTVPAANNSDVQFALYVGAIVGGNTELDALSYTFNLRCVPEIVYVSSSTYKLNLLITTSSGTTTLTGTTVLNTGAWNIVEVNYVANSSTVGGGGLWINYNPEVSNYTLNTTEANAAPTRAYAGLESSLTGSTSGTIYLDDYAYDTAYIGTRTLTNFALTSTSPVILKGADLNGAFNVGLLSGSTWPEGVLTGIQNYPWNIGAYVTPGGINPFWYSIP